MSSRGFAFVPGSWVLVTFCGVNYRGRVVTCKWLQGQDLFHVEYVDDRAEIRTNDFAADELQQQ